MTPFYGGDRPGTSRTGSGSGSGGGSGSGSRYSTQRRGCATITSGILGIKAGLNKPHFLEKCPQSFLY